MATRIISSLSYIEVGSPDPLKLFLQWKNEAAACSSTTNIMCIATSAKDGRVSNRNVALQDVTDGLVFVAKKNGRKIQDILNNPIAAATFLYIYTEAEQRAVARQIRIEGTVVELDRSICENYFRNQPISGQIRDVLCNQGQEVDWNDLKRKHDELLQKLEREEILQLRMPENQAAWKIIPERFDFYYSLNAGIADRVVFTKANYGKWEYVHVAA